MTISRLLYIPLCAATSTYLCAVIFFPDIRYILLCLNLDALHRHSCINSMTVGTMFILHILFTVLYLLIYGVYKLQQIGERLYEESKNGRPHHS